MLTLVVVKGLAIILSSNHTVSTGEQLEHFRSSPPANRSGGLIENDFRLLGKQEKKAQAWDVFYLVMGGREDGLRVLFRGCVIEMSIALWAEQKTL